jgi:soluble cytochrome b562
LKKDKKADDQEDYDTYLHGMDEVIDSTEKQKLADEAALNKCISGGK